MIGGAVGAVLLGTFSVALSRTADRVVPLASRSAVDKVGTVVLSARRTPTTLSDSTRIGALERALASFGSMVPDGGCLRVDWAGRTVTSVRSDRALVPASAAKVVTAVAAVDVLGADHTFETAVWSTGTMQNGTIGDLYLVGGGDPVLVHNGYVATEKYQTFNGTQLEKFADSIVSTGLRLVTGSIVAIDSRYDQVRFVDAWPSEFHVTEAGPLGALLFNDGAVTGQTVKPDDPAVAAATELRQMLTARGVTFTGGIRHDAALPAEATKIASITSAPLTAIIREMLVNSDNNTAEMLLKEIGWESSEQGSTASGLATLAKAAAAWKVTAPVMLDGSGLSRADSVSCDTFVSILDARSDLLTGSMAVAGVSGTLRDVFTDSPMKDRLVGKTGTLSGVKSLVGYLPLEGAQPIVFALLMNRDGIDNQGEYRPIWNALGEALNRAKAHPTRDELAP